MNNASRNRNHPDHKYEQQILKTDLCHTAVSSMQELVLQYAHVFDLTFLPPPQPPQAMPITQAMAVLYKKTKQLFESNQITFDNHWHWIVPWRQAISFESLTEMANDDAMRVIRSFHPKSHSALTAIFNHGLESYMRWYPWSWFSDLVFLGAGGFSAVYGAHVELPYDVPTPFRKRTVALKVVDEKILNEIAVQSKAFVALLFHGMTVCESTGDLMMILTLAEESNLNGQILKTSETSFTKIVDMVTRLALNLASLHDEIGMCHRNIHPENILCADDDYFLVDFRFSTASHEATQVTRTNGVHYGRLPYIAPEVAQGEYTEKSDVYSLGIIMWQLISGVLFPSPEVLLASPELYSIEWVPGVCQWYQQVTMACLEPQPENRPTAEEIGLILRKAGNVSSSSPTDWKAYVTKRQEQLVSQQNNTTGTTCSRLYTLEECALSRSLFSHVSFTNRPFDADSIAFQVVEEGQ